MAEGYEDIDRWSNEQKSLLGQQQQQQNDLINQQTQLTVDELERNRNKVDQDVTKTTRGLYTDYQKQANQYGVEAERQAQMGLANSGYAETSKVNLYNNYQKNVTETLNNARNLKADFDFQIAQARKQGNITQAQTALELLKQRMQLLTQEYEMRNNRKQFIYQQQRDAVADSQWREQFDYQKQRDAVSDSQWERQFELSKKAQATRARRSSRSSSKKSSKGNVVNTGDSVSNSSGASTGSSAQSNKVNVSEHSLDKKIEATLATTKANSKARDNFLSGLVKSGRISNEQKAYLMGV